jgi:pyruvate dehydrogenase E2 component (dihydrolipoamide acetyltransferase)
MPQLGLTMEEGTVTTWLKHEGDKVEVGEPIVEITTDKLTNEVNSEAAGVLLKIVAQEGEDVPVKGLLAYIGEPGEKVGDGAAAAAPAAEAAPAAAAPAAAEPAAPAPAPKTVNGKRIRISPLARKTAAKMGVDYTNIKGSGPQGRIIQKDILAAAKNPAPAAKKEAAAAPAPAPVVEHTGAVELMDGDVVEKLTGMRKVVGKRMLQSVTECPTVTQNVKVDVTELFKLRKEINEKMGVKYSVNDFVLKAVAKALKNNRYMLVAIDGQNVIKRAHINLGMAVALDDGLLTPVIRDADKMSLSEIHDCAKDLATRARNGKLAVEEYKGSTFTVSNLGMFGVETFNPIINQPDSSILGVCAAQDELYMDDDGKISKHKVMRISHTFDHRLIDGSVAAKFECAVRDLLQNPMEILL